jgi:hypothetical protein
MKSKFVLLAVVSATLFGVTTAISPASAGAAAAITPDTIATIPAHIGEPYAAVLSSTPGATWNVTSGQLPPGLSLAAGVISGVPTQGGAYTFVVQAKLGTAASKRYTILVYLPASSGYESRAGSVIFARDASPPAGSCNQTGFASYAIADLWVNRNPADVNAKLASLQFSHYGGDPSACSSNSNQARNNLMLGYLLRPYFLYNSRSSWFPGRMTTAASDNLVKQMWTYASSFSKVSQAANTWSIYDSENHDAQAEGFYFLAAQIFKNTPGYDTRKYADHRTAAQHYKAWHDHWSKYLDERAKRGLFIETAAPTYHAYTIGAIVNIYDFAEDPILRRKAGMVLDLDFADYAQQQLHNIWGGAKSRSYPGDSYDGNLDSMTSIGNLVFGPGTSIGADNHVLMFATSGYMPPAVVQNLASDHAGLGSFEYTTRRPGDGTTGPDLNKNWQVDPSRSVLNYAYSTPDYVMGTTELNPNFSHIAPSSQNRWQGIIFNTGGGKRVYPQAGPSSFSPANDAFLSVQHKSTLITEKRFYADEPTLVYFPTGLAKLTARGGWVFVKEGGAFLAVRPALGKYVWLTRAKNNAANRDQRFIRLTDEASPIIFEAARASSYASLAAFENRILHNPLKHSASAVTYKSSDGTNFKMPADTGSFPRVNGKPPNYSPALVFNSPFMKSTWGSGRVTIKRGALRATYDFSHSADPVKVAN